MKTTVYRVSLVTTTPMLGSQPTVDIATEFIAGKAGIELPEDEVLTLPQELEKGTTVFHKLDGAPVLFDYQIKGFMKEAARASNGRVRGGVKNLAAKVEQYVFICPRVITMNVDGMTIDYCVRPLRAETARGPRTAIARSEMLPAGVKIDFQLSVVYGALEQEVLEDLLDYGELKGLGQFRNGGYGRFEYVLEKE